MVALLVGAVLAGEPDAPACDPVAALASLRAYDAAARASYLCLATADTGGVVLVGAIDALHEPPARAAPAAGAPPTGEEAAPVEGTPEEVVLAVTTSDAAVEARFDRALALWLLNHADVAWQPSLVARLGAADRRLLADGVHAVRGRKSPAPEHEAVFRQFAWYRPNPKYTDNLLSATDRGNIALANEPPPPPAPPPRPPTEAAAPPPEGGSVATGGSPDRGWCGCTSAALPAGGRGAVPGGVLAAMLGGAILAVRRRPDR